MYLTDNGKLYATGDGFLRTIQCEQNKAEYYQIEVPEDIKVNKIICSNNDNDNYCYLQVEKEGKPELWTSRSEGASVGWARFKKLDYEEGIEFTKVKIGQNHSVALTTTGELYVWGENGNKQLGIESTDEIKTPTKNPNFDDYIILDFDVGANHTVLKASPKDNKEKIVFFHLGPSTGLSEDNRSSYGSIPLTHFDNFSIDSFFCTYSSSFFYIEGEDLPSDNVGIHHGYTCDVTQQCPVVGTMHFYKDGEGWHFLSKEGYEQKKNELPNICYATKYYIEDIQGKTWPEVNASELLEESKDHFEPSYLASVEVDDEKLVPMPETTDYGIFEKEAHDINPLIFFRITRPIKDDQSLPKLKLVDFFPRTELFGIKVEADPDYSFMKNDIIMALEFEKYQNIQNRIQLFDAKHDQELMKQIENNLTMMQQNFVECPYVFVMVAELEFEDHALRVLPTENVQSRLDSLVMFNQYLLKSLPFLYFDEDLLFEENSDGERVLQSESLTACFIMGKKYALENIITNYLKTVSDGLPTDYSTPSIEMNTLDIKKWYDTKKVDNKGQYTMFGKIFQKMREKSYQICRIQASTNYGWYSYFTNEGYQNSGTFRKSLTQMCEELHSEYLPLFIPSPNNKKKEGKLQDAWVINPACTSGVQLQMYTAVGALIGQAFRSGNPMNFRFPPLFWKKFLCEPLTLEDLESTDLQLYNSLNGLSNPSNSIPLQKTAWVTTLSDGTKIELKENGEDEYVSEKDAKKFINLSLSTRFQENKAQMDAIRTGFDVVFPSEVARILNWEDVESRVRGDPFDMEKIKGNTDFNYMSADDEWGQKYHNVLKSLTPEEQTRYLRAWTCRDRLPPNKRLEETRFKVYMREDYYYSSHDEELPTFEYEYCSVYFPRFSTEEIWKKQLLKAIEKTEKYLHFGKRDEEEEENILNSSSGSEETDSEEEEEESEIEDSDESDSDSLGDAQREGRNRDASERDSSGESDVTSSDY